MEQYIQSLIGGLAIILRLLPMHDEALDEAYQPLELYNVLRRHNYDNLPQEGGEQDG